MTANIVPLVTFYTLYVGHNTYFIGSDAVSELTAAFWALDRAFRIFGRMVMSLSWRYADGTGATRKAELTSYGNGAYIRMRTQIPASRLHLPTSPASSSLASSFDLDDDGNSRLSGLASLLRSSTVLNPAKIGAGDDIRITIPKLQWVGEHPFSVFAVGRCKLGIPGMGYVDLVIQRQGGITHKLSKLAEQLSTPAVFVGRSPSDASLQLADRPKGKRVRVVVDGPFGRSPSLEGAHHAVLVAGGIAITFCYPLFVKAARGDFRSLESCKLVWIVRNEAILDVLRDSLPELLDEIKRRRGSRCRLSIDIYVTTKPSITSAKQLNFVTTERKPKLPKRLEPTWQSTSSTLYTSSSSVTLASEGNSWLSGSPQTPTSKSQASEDVRYKRPCEVEFVPTLSNGHALHQELPKLAFATKDIVLTPTDSRSFSPKSLQMQHSPSLSQVRSCSTPRRYFPSVPKSAKLASSGAMIRDDVERGIPFIHSTEVHEKGRDEAQEVLLRFQAREESASGAETPLSAYADSISSSQYTGYRIQGGYNKSTRELQLQYMRDNLSSAASVVSFLHSDSPRVLGLPSWSSNQQEELQRHLLDSQDVLAEVQDGLIEIRRFQGRPSSMAAVHRHVPQREADATGRVVFATCGPAPMCDSVRAEVVALLKKGIDVALIEDCFNW